MEFRYLWRDAMASKDGPESPIVRLTLFVLEKYMDGAAECYPSTRLVAEGTGLERKAVMRALRTAEKTGWLEIIERSQKEGQGWRRHKYRGKIPVNLQKVESPGLHVKAEGGTTEVPPMSEKVVPPRPDVVPPRYKRGTPEVPEPTIEPIKNQPIENIRRKSAAVSEKRQDKKNALSPVAVELSQHLLDAILSNHPGFKKPNLTSWAKHTELMLRRDSRTPEDIRAVSTWCQQDQFWKSNVLSTRTLRDKFDRLYIQMKESKNGQRISGGRGGTNRKGQGANSGPPAAKGKYDGIGVELVNEG